MKASCKITSAATLLVTVLVLLHTALAGEFREFENTEGKKITAKVVRLDGDHVELLVQNGKTYRLATSTLSQKDQAFLKNWKAPVPDVSLDIRTARTSVGGRKRIREPGYKKTEANWAFKVTLKNRRNIAIDQPLKAVYQVFIKHKD